MRCHGFEKTMEVRMRPLHGGFEACSSTDNGRCIEGRFKVGARSDSEFSNKLPEGPWIRMPWTLGDQEPVYVYG